MPETGEGVVTFPERVDFSAVEGAEVLHLTVEKDFLEKAEQNAKLFGAEIGEFQEQKSGGPKLIEYDNGKDQYMNISEDGGMAQGAGFGYDPVKNTVEHMYQEEELRGEATDVNVQLADGSVNLAQFCQHTEQWLETQMAVGGGIHYKVSDAYVRQKKTGGKKAGKHPSKIILYVCRVRL